MVVIGLGDPGSIRSMDTILPLRY